MISLTCMECGIQYDTYRCWAKRPGSKFCSRACADKGKNRRPKTLITFVCEECGKGKSVRKGYGAGVNRFCSQKCRDKNRRTANYGRSRDGRHSRWANFVVARDGKCVRCGIADCELHAHHISSYRDDAERRYDLSNGETLCVECHVKEHPGLAYLLRTHKQPRFIKDCPMCGMRFVRTTRTQKFCSRKCAALNTRILHGGDMTCANCGTRFLGKPSRHPSELKFCTKNCSIRWFGESQGGRKEWIRG